MTISVSSSSLSSSSQSTSTPPSQLTQLNDKYNCILCGKWLKSKVTLRNHENNYHKFNKIIPHFSVLSSSDDVEKLKQCIIINIQKKLGFSRHNIGVKKFILEPFPENVFALLFSQREDFFY